jgi:hypothetical protein
MTSENVLTKESQTTRIWRYIKANPGVTAKAMSLALDIPHQSVSPCLTMLYRAKAVTTKQRSFINEHARKQSVWHYEAVGDSTPDLSKKRKKRVSKDASSGVVSVAHTAAEVVPVTTDLKSEAEEFKLWLEFRRLKTAGLL